MSKEIAEEYASSLSDLTVNSKPLINMLTILAEENVDHAGVIVETVEKHLEKVPPEIKLPVLYLVDSIIKNVGGAYTQKFSASIVNMFTRTFKQVDEKIRSQMFKLRETWHDMFPPTKLYQLDVKVNLIDPAWPIQAQPQQSNIHTVATTSAAPPLKEDEEKMRSILAKKEQELLMLQRKKIEMELEQTRRQLEMAEKNVKKVPNAPPPSAMPVAMVTPSVVAPALLPHPDALPVKSRLGPPVHKQSGGRIAPVSGALAAARRDPRLARHHPPPPPLIQQTPPIASNVFDIKPLERVTKRKNVITIDVNPEEQRPQLRDPRRRDPRLEKRPEERSRREKARARDDRRKADEDRLEKKKEEERLKKEEAVEKKREETRKIDIENKKNEDKTNNDKNSVDKYLDQLIISDPKRINKLPPIPKINRDEARKDTPSPIKRKKEIVRNEKKKKRDDSASSKDSTSSSSPDKKSKENRKQKTKERLEVEEKNDNEVVAFKELKNYHKERYMRRNKEKSESPETIAAADKTGDRLAPETESPSVPEVVEAKDVDLRVLPAVELKPAAVGQKRSSTETMDTKAKKNKLDKFDILFGNEDVDLRQLPQVEEAVPPPPTLANSPKPEANDEVDEFSPQASPKKDWNEVKEATDEVKKTPTKLDLVRAKLAEATKGKDRLGRPLLFSKSPSEEKERRRTISSEDTDLRVEPAEEFDAEDHKKTISIIMSQAKEQFSDGKLDKSQYNALMYQVLQLNEKLKLKEAKQRESLEISKRKLKAHSNENHKPSSPKSSPNTFGDIDERITPAYMDTPPDSQGFLQDSDMRMNMIDEGPRHSLMPRPPAMPMFMQPGPYPNWRGQPRPRVDEYVPRRFRGPNPPYYRGMYDKRAPRPQFDPRQPILLPTPQIGMSQNECPLERYERCVTPPPLGAPGVMIPPTDFRVLEYIDQDPVKTIQIDGVPREIRFYGETAVIMLEWDDPREIKFLPGCRRATFDNKDSVVLSFNEPYKQVEIDDQVFNIRYGAPTREMYINGRWFECFFGGQPLGVIIDGKPRLVHLEGPLPQVDIGKVKRTDLVAGKINLIVNATQMFPVYLDAKVQKFVVNGQFYTIRFVDSLRTVLINEQPFRVEYGDLPKPIFLGNEKCFIRFSALPRNIKPGLVDIAGMQGSCMPSVPRSMPLLPILPDAMEVDQEPMPRPLKTPSPEVENQGLDMLASVMPSSMEAPASASAYSLAEPLFCMPDKIPGLETPAEDKPILPILGNINVTDLFAKLVATGIVQMPNDAKKEEVREEVKAKPKEDKSVVHRVDLMRSESLRGKQPGVVSKLYGGMQCSGCGARFPPEHTVRYSQHLDWHFRQNRRDRDSARRAHSRHWHYDLSDWMQYEELEEAEEREKSWFETSGAEEGEGPPEPAAEAPSVAAGAPQAHYCALCGDKFDQFYNEDKEEWHLRNSVRNEDKYYHPVCFEDYKTSLSKPEAPQEDSDDVVVAIEKDEAIVIRDVDDTASQSDNDDVVEVVEQDTNEPLEIDEGDEDDVLFKEEPVDEVVVNDDADTDDETSAERAERDRLVEIDFAKVKVKQEPVDPDDEPIITSEEENIQPSIDTTHTSVITSIDGNIQLEATVAPATNLGGIRINISKSLPAFVAPQEDRMEDTSADDEPLPPGEEVELEYTLKPNLVGVSFSRQPPVQKGSELSGLCSIM